MQIAAHQYWHLKVIVENPLNFALFEINVDRHLDIGVYIVDSENFTLWANNYKAISAGALANRLPTVTMFCSTRWQWGTLVFKPPKPGIYHLILDNTYSKLTEKSIKLTFYKLQVEDVSRRSVREVCIKRGWNTVWSCFEDADASLSQGKLAGCCDSLRRGLINLMVKSTEVLSGERIDLEQGKSTNISLIKTKLKAYIPDYTITPLMQAWSLASELAKTERRDGSEPPLNQVLLAYRIVYIAAAYIVSIQVGVNPQLPQGFCMKCQATRYMKNAHRIFLKNGRPALNGERTICNTAIFRIGNT
jgi:hypothetical protein